MGSDRQALDPTIERLAAWVQRAALAAPEGLIWPRRALSGSPAKTSLYHGTAGVLLFLGEMTRETHDRAVDETLRQGASALAVHVRHEQDEGLYTGLVGEAFTLRYVSEMTGETRYHDAARAALMALCRRIRAANGHTSAETDVMGGAAGVGLGLIAAREQVPEAIDAVRTLGEWLLARGEPAAGDGLRWRASHGAANWTLGFAHGTAGIAYFLASLSLITGERAPLDAAMAGARYLLRSARSDGPALTIHATEPEGVNDFYLGWCNGPLGVSRLFYRLAQATGDPAWAAQGDRFTDTVLRSGIPDAKPANYWGKIGRCCGSSGIGDHLLDLLTPGDGQTRHGEPRDEPRNGGPYDSGQQDDGRRREHERAALVRRLLADVLARSEEIMSADPESLARDVIRVPNVGLMQGLAGVGLWLLRVRRWLDAAPDRRVPLPDSPFRAGW